MSTEYEITVPRWTDFQHYPKGTIWIKLYAALGHDRDFLRLTWADRGLLVSIWIEYALANHGREPKDARALLGSTAELGRSFGQKLTSVQLERLNHAGWIELRSREGLEEVESSSRTEESKPLEENKPSLARPVENSEDQAPAARESRLELVTEAVTEPGDLAGPVGASCGPEPIRKDGLAPGSVSASVRAPAEKPNAPKRDELWDLLEAELGSPATQSEHGRRNRAVKELREIGATPELVRGRLAAYRERWPHIALTATALVANWTVLGQPAPTAQRRTGYRLVRGTHGTTYVEDPAGVDRPPAGAA